MRKLSTVLIVGLVSILVAASCTTASSPPSPGASTTAAASQAPVTISMMADLSDQFPATFWTGLFAKFQAKYPRITVNYIPTAPGQRDDRARQLLATGDFPDVVQLAPSVYKDYVLTWDLNDPDLKQLQNVNAQTIGGKLYSLGIGNQSWGLMLYNKDMFAKAGITSTPKTLNEFDADLAKLKAAGFTPILGAGEWVPAFTINSLSDVYQMTPCYAGLLTSGTRKFTDQEWIDNVTRIAGYIQKGYFNKSPLGINYAQLNDQFIKGGGAIYTGGGWMAGVLAQNPPAFEVGEFALPVRDGQLRMTGSVGAFALMVSKTTKHEAEARLLTKWLALDADAESDLLNALGFQPNAKPNSGTIKLNVTPLGQAMQDEANKAVSFTTSWGGQGDCTLKTGVGDQWGPLVMQPLYLNPNQPVLPLLQSLQDFNDKAKP